ncbi:hypothetical protein KAI87_13830 [Myxococcota bacterium]|nr:hypothetical protein [Myxococcota bacterium]
MKIRYLGRSVLTSMVLVASVALMGCDTSEPGSTGGTLSTVELMANSDGDLEACDANGTCVALPNPDECAILTLEINNMTGETCETCFAEDGTVISESCENTTVECTVITAPEPDCVVCAHVGGSVVHSSCVVEQPDNCDVFSYADPEAPVSSDSGSASSGDPSDSTEPAFSCEMDMDCPAPYTCMNGMCELQEDCRVCYGPDGNIILDECGQDCSNVMCPAVECAPDFMPHYYPGECCPHCVPIDNCMDVECAQMDFVAIDCPEGMMMTRDPFDCCGFICEPVGCPPMPAGAEYDDSGASVPEFRCEPDASDTDELQCPDGLSCVEGLCLMACNAALDCPSGAACINGVCEQGDPSVCPEGWERNFDFPDCGACVPVYNERYCTSDDECNTGAGEICSVTEECLFDNTDPASAECGCFEECYEDGTCTAVCYDCTQECMGICKPENVVCPDYAYPSEDFCPDGYIEVPGRDEMGCPLPPVCVCDSGEIAINGVCGDACADIMCPAVQIICDEGSHLENDYPYCCGHCVMDDPCATKDPCSELTCLDGYRCEERVEFIDCDDASAGGMDCGTGATCVAVCVAEEVPCTSSEDCGSDQRCTVEFGDCDMPPDCFEDGSNMVCADVCYGVCADLLDITPGAP